MSDYLQEAFDKVCTEAKKPETWYVSLVESVPYYGGPEEGGWWGRDRVLHAFQGFPTKELAEAAAEQVKGLAQDLAAEARRSYGQQCLREMERCDKMGVDYDYFPEPDGPSEFDVIVTEEIPQNSRGSRQYC